MVFAVVAVAQTDAGILRWAGLAVGVLGAGLSLFIARGSGNWTTRNKYDRDAHTSTDEPDSVSDWDALTRGEDPT
nr:Trp biosynthesis-associated membrane protein [Brevibacterium sp. ACRRH]